MEMVQRVELIHPEAESFHGALGTILGRAPDETLKPALPYSVIVRNLDARAIALLGVRFDMLGPRGKKYSVVHYADMLRYPEKADLRPGAMRFVCAEPLYTDLVLRGGSVVDRRGPMNLQNLRTMLRVRASLDCVAFDDGQFAGPDSLGAFERFGIERKAEAELLEEIARQDGAILAMLERALEIPAAQARNPALLARKLLSRRLLAGGPAEAADRVRNHRLRIQLWR